MKIGKYQLQAAHRIAQGQRIDGYVEMPEGANIIHIGATPPAGEMCVFAEVSEIDMPMTKKTVVVLKENDSVPKGYKYMGYILAVPILFVYEQDAPKIALNS